MEAPDSGSVTLGERTINLPTSISDEAKAYLRALLAAPALPLQFPKGTDPAEWNLFIAAFDAGFLPVLEQMSAGVDAIVDEREIGGVRTVWATPRTLAPELTKCIVMHIHGGGLVVLGGAAMRHWALLECEKTGLPVVAVDYRMPPDNPYPAGIEDCVAVYSALVQSYCSSRIAITGSSGGAHFAAVTTLRIRDSGLPLPGAVMLHSPELDLTESGDTFQTNAGIDLALPRGLPEPNTLYAAGHDLADPELSPIFADFSPGFPPVQLQSGTRDLFLSNAVRMHRALRRHGVKAELHVGEAMVHGGFGGNTPEDAEMNAEYRRFLHEHLTF